MRADAKKRAKRTGWVVFALVAIFGLIIIRFATSGTVSENFFSGMPSSDDAFSVAKDFIRPALRSSYADFSDEGYHFAKKADSVYVIKSYVDVGPDEEKQRIDFTVVMRYKGGIASYSNNWELQEINTR